MAIAQRVMLASVRKDLTQPFIIRDELPDLVEGEIRLRVDKVGLSANNLFYAQMGEAPFLKFFSVYPLVRDYKHLANVPAWGVATIIESKNKDFAEGEQYRGFLHISNVVQMKAKRTEQGFDAYGGLRNKINPAYNSFIKVGENDNSPIRGEGPKSDLAMTAAPGASSGFMLYELIKGNEFYAADNVVLTSASSKLSLAIALLLKEQKDKGDIKEVVGYTSAGNSDFVKRTGLYDRVLTYDQKLHDELGDKNIFIDVAGDGAIYKSMKHRICKGLAVGGTHADAKSSTFTAFSPSGILKMIIDMTAPKSAKKWAAKNLSPKLEMFFAPNVINDLLERWGKEEMDRRANAALTAFVDAAIDEGWISVDRSESIDDVASAYQRIMVGKVPPSQAVILSLVDAA